MDDTNRHYGLLHGSTEARTEAWVNLEPDDREHDEASRYHALAETWIDPRDDES